MNLRTTIRRCFPKIWNKQFLIFLFFLALSSAFWVFQAVNETYEQDFTVPLELRNIPENVMITTDLPTSLHVQLRDKGIQLMAYRYTRQFRPVAVDFEAYANPTGHVSIPGSSLLRQIAAQLLPGTQLLTLKPDTIDFFYNYGQCKRVPVVMQGIAMPKSQFSLSRVIFSADSVTVFADQTRLDTITGAYLRPFNLSNQTDTTKVKGVFQKVKGVKFVPSEIDVTFCIDRLVEKTVQVPVQQVNFPASKQLLTFPAKVNVTFQVTMGQYRRITSDSFVLVVNYEDLLKCEGNRCHLALKTIPEGVSHVRINPQDVEFVIEEIPDYERQSD